MADAEGSQTRDTEMSKDIRLETEEDHQVFDRPKVFELAIAAEG
jgi:hypothetical protein